MQIFESTKPYLNDPLSSNVSHISNTLKIVSKRGSREAGKAGIRIFSYGCYFAKMSIPANFFKGFFRKILW